MEKHTGYLSSENVVGRISLYVTDQIMPRRNDHAFAFLCLPSAVCPQLEAVFASVDK